MLKWCELSSTRFGTDARILLNLFQELTGAILSVVSDVPVDSETPLVISSISRICWLSLSNVLIEIGLHAYFRRNKCVCVSVNVCVIRKKNC